MKSITRYSLLFCLACVCGLLASCADDLLVTPTTDPVGQPLELTVSQATIPATRLELGQDWLTTVWQPRDQLVLVKKDRSSAPIYLNCTLTEPASSATFASESGVPAGDYWVIYNYNENLAYGHHGFSSVDEINEQNKLVLYGELNLTAGASTASVEMHHLYAQVMVELKNVPEATSGMADGGSYTIGMYSSKKGMPIYKQFTANGLVNAEYGVNPNDLNNYNNNSTYFPSDKRWHNIRFGQYNVNGTWVEGYSDPNTGEWVESHFQTSDEQFSNSALILPEDLSQEDVFFYVITNEGDNSKCYEIKKALGKVNLKAGIRYKVVLDLAETDVNTTVTTLNYGGSPNGSVFEISTPAQWRHATYKGDRDVCYGYRIADNIDFTGEYFFPLNTQNIDGNEKTLSNIELDWSDEDNVGLYKTEWKWNTWNDVTHTSDNGHMETVQPKQSYCNISNLTLESVTFKGKSYVGAFGGYNVQADNCKVVGTSVISGSGDYVGGVVGWNSLSFDYMLGLLLSEVSVGQNCIVTGVYYVGGIVGAYEAANNYEIHFSSSQQPLNNCVSSATVTATGDYVGGIFGKMGGYNTNSSSSNINFSMDDYTYTLLKCQNRGNVTGKDYVGGIGGDFALSCYSGSSVDRVVLRQSFSDGKVKGDNYVGGILGRSMASVNTCYSINFIEGTTNVGGIVGVADGMMGCRIANCYSLSALTVGAEGAAGGILGTGGMIMVTNSYFAGTNPTDCGIIGNSYGCCTVDHCLTTLPSLGTNLDTSPTARPSNPRQEWDDNTGQTITVYDYYPDAITASEFSVTSILDKKTIINGDNAYSDNYWPLATYPYYCVKFDSFSADTNAPDYGSDVID